MFNSLNGVPLMKSSSCVTVDIQQLQYPSFFSRGETQIISQNKQLLTWCRRLFRTLEHSRDIYPSSVHFANIPRAASHEFSRAEWQTLVGILTNIFHLSLSIFCDWGRNRKKIQIQLTLKTVSSTWRCKVLKYWETVMRCTRSQTTNAGVK